MIRPWKTTFNISFDSGKTIVEEIAASIREEIVKGRLERGAPLPGTRTLANDLGVNRKTVVFAYESLIADGWAEARLKSGTFVSDKLPEIKGLNTEEAVKMESNFEIREFISAPLTEKPTPGNLIFFNEGAPDANLAPLKELSRAYRRILDRQGKWRILGYGDERGDLKLREMLTLFLSRDRGFHADPENICITKGSQMALYLTARVLINHGDTVVVENPGYPAVRRLFAENGALVKTVEVDQEGIDINALESLCKNDKIKAVYVTPHHQFPTTVTMKAGRRIELLELSIKYSFAIIEDDYDHEYHFGAGNNLALASSEMAVNVIYISSYSKLIAPAIRVGYITGPNMFMKSLISLRAQIDRQGDNILEHAIADLMEDGTIGRHAKKAVSIYRNRRDLMEKCLTKDFGTILNHKRPEGGLAYWIEFNEKIDFNKYAELLKRKHIQIVPPETFYNDGLARFGMRLGYGSLNEEELENGIKTLAEVYNEMKGQ
ncbi:PLP-dependent aminotransferase family protein [Pedobacter sp. ASV1-7]|uniref:MocR-like pyridoxine biosynthesis transcription factor PdxR n=1 Tax=Pedobacter sp. ASV1-7 TaxID=3145237 RepID=UPI0032E8E6CB